MFYKSLKKHVLCLFYGFYCYVLWFFICKLMFFNIYGVNATVAEAYGIDASLFYVSVGSAGGGESVRISTQYIPLCVRW